LSSASRIAPSIPAVSNTDTVSGAVDLSGSSSRMSPERALRLIPRPRTLGSSDDPLSERQSESSVTSSVSRAISGVASRFTSPAVAARSISASAQGPAEQEQLGLRVLVAEDSTTIAKLMISWLTRRGCKVTHVVSGQEAVDTVLRAAYPRLPQLPRLSAIDTFSDADRDTQAHMLNSEDDKSERDSSLNEHKRLDQSGISSAASSNPLTRAVPSSATAPDSESISTGSSVFQTSTPAPSPFDVILMDQHMPGNLTGIRATELLRSYGFSMPIYGVTADVFSEVEAAFTNAGATRVLTKPVNWQQLHIELSQVRDSLMVRTLDQISTTVRQ